MLRGLALLSLCGFLLAGCASPPEASVADVTAAPAPAPERGETSFEGSYDGLVLQGEQVQGSGGSHAIEVGGGGWTEVLVRLDVQVETTLYLRPPGCEGNDCAVAIASPAGNTDILETVARMEPGTWTTGMELQGSQARYGSSVYTLTLEYTQA